MNNVNYYNKILLINENTNILINVFLLLLIDHFDFLFSFNMHWKIDNKSINNQTNFERLTTTISMTYQLMINNDSKYA